MVAPSYGEFTELIKLVGVKECDFWLLPWRELNFGSVLAELGCWDNRVGTGLFRVRLGSIVICVVKSVVN